MKKALILLLAAIIGIGLFVSCSNEPSYDSLKGTWTYEGFDTTTGGSKIILEFDGLGNFVLSHWTAASPYAQVLAGTYHVKEGYIYLNASLSDVPSRHSATYPAVMFRSPDTDDDEYDEVWLMVTDDDEGPYKFDAHPESAKWENFRVDETGTIFSQGDMMDSLLMYSLDSAELPTKLTSYKFQVFFDTIDEEK